MIQLFNSNWDNNNIIFLAVYNYCRTRILCTLAYVYGMRTYYIHYTIVIQSYIIRIDAHNTTYIIMSHIREQILILFVSLRLRNKKKVKFKLN